MIDKIIENLLLGLISRIENLEREITELKGKKTNFDYPKKEVNKNNEASIEQLKFLMDLGVDVPKEITKYEASILLKETLEKKKNKETDNTTPEPELKEEINTEEYPDY